MYTLQRPTRGSGNAGMGTPYEQGFQSGARGEPHENFYDQPGEEVEYNDYQIGWINGNAARQIGT